MKILVLGSGGQLGTDCMQLLKSGHEVTGLNYPDIDIGDRRSVAAAIESAAPEIIINCAAYTAVDQCETDRQAAWQVNAEGPRHIGDIAGPVGCRIIHVSTDYVFDGTRRVPEPYVEGDPVHPLSEYGRGKLAGERALLERAPEALILRTAWLYSAHGHNFLKTMLRLALSDPDRRFTIVDDQYGSLTWADTLARQIERLLSTSISGIVHATADGYSSWYEGACYFLDKMAVPHSFVPCTTGDYPTAAPRPANSILRNRVLDEGGLSVFGSWQRDVDRFVARFKAPLLSEAQALLKR